MKIEELNFSARTYNILKRAQIDTVEQLKQLSNDDLMRVRNLGRHSFEEIKEKLERYTITNADCIRAMNDDGLTEIFCGFLDNTFRLNSINAVLSDKFREDFKEWLKQPYKEKE